ncbi:MAG: hypothetical protein JNM88_13525, partial [Chitinophagaceae bacterium]|nr:hypothetical protein [Chitinophagaceae bacterium]
DSLNADSLALLRPARGFFRYDEDNYQSRFTGRDTFTYYYNGKNNRCISAEGEGRELACEDYSLPTDTVLSVKDYATAETVLGYPCRILEMQKSGSWVKYYYATGLHIAPATYEKHRAYNWDAYGTKADGGLILKLEHRFRSFTMKGEATRVKSETAGFRALGINDSLFSSVCK